MNVLCETSPPRSRPAGYHVETRDGEQKIKCDRIIARMGSSPPRKFVEACGIKFTSDDRDAYPQLSPEFETTVPGIYVIGALAGYPLIKHCMNQGYDVIEFINGNTELKPADEPILEEKFSVLPGARSVIEWLAFLRRRVSILNDLSPLQMREFMLDSEPPRLSRRRGPVRAQRAGRLAVRDRRRLGAGRGRPQRPVEDRADRPGLDRRRGRADLGPQARRHRAHRRGAIVIEIPRSAALKLMATNSAAKREITRISTERQLLQMFRSA